MSDRVKWRPTRPSNPRRTDVSEQLELLARSLRPIYPLEVNSGFEELLRAIDQR